MSFMQSFVRGSNAVGALRRVSPSRAWGVGDPACAWCFDLDRAGCYRPLPRRVCLPLPRGGLPTPTARGVPDRPAPWCDYPGRRLVA